MTDQEIAAVFRDVYNDWWLKWKMVPATEKNLDAMSQEGYRLIRKHGAKPLVTHMVNELVNVLDERGREATNNGKKE